MKRNEASLDGRIIEIEIERKRGTFVGAVPSGAVRHEMTGPIRKASPGTRCGSAATARRISRTDDAAPLTPEDDGPCIAPEHEPEACATVHGGARKSARQLSAESF